MQGQGEGASRSGTPKTKRYLALNRSDFPTNIQ